MNNEQWTMNNGQWTMNNLALAISLTERLLRVLPSIYAPTLRTRSNRSERTLVLSSEWCKLSSEGGNLRPSEQWTINNEQGERGKEGEREG